MIYFGESDWKRAGVILMAGLLLFLSACGIQKQPVAPQPIAQNAPSVPAELPEDDRLGYSLLCTLPNMNSQTMTLIARGVQDRCDALGIDVQMHNSHDDHMTQALELDAFVAQGGQAVLCQPVDSAALQPFLQLARQQGVFVVSWGEGVDAEVSVSVDYHVAGSLLAKNAAVWAKGQDGYRPTAVLLVSESTRPEFSAGVAEGYAKSFPDEEAEVQILTIGEEGIPEEFLALMPKSGIILGDTDEAVLLAREFLALKWQEEQKEGEPDWNRYYFGGYGANLNGLAALANGEIQASISENGYEAGAQMVKMAVSHLQGNSVESRKIPPVVVDKRNAARYT